MPGVTSDELIRRVRGIQPRSRVLLISGYSESRIASEFGNEGLSGFLQKPFPPETLVEKVRDLLS